MAASTLTKKLLTIDGAYLLMAVASVLVPRFFRSGEGGTAGATGAVLLFLFLFSAASVLAAAGLVITLRARKTANIMQLTIGILPMVISTTFFGWFFFSLRY